MCGIFGYLTPHPSQHNPLHLLHTLTHRGPDECGYWQDDHIFLGMHRLSIIDLATGQQPIWNENRTLCIIYNGELYNYLDLRPGLEAAGHIFQTHSDTEVILHAYEEWGTACLQKLNGMFAFAIWNTLTQTLFVARDRLGEKPLYYYHDPERLIFASEIKAITADPTIPRQISWPGLANYLTFGHALAPQTIYQNIFKLLPGHYFLFQNNQLTLSAYWDVGQEPFLPPGRTYTPAEYATQIRTLLQDSVQRRMIADVPVGAFLSGGVDSSAIVACMCQHTNQKVKTFSLGFAVGGEYNELADARQVAQFLGTDHYELNVAHVDLIETLQQLVYHYDEPFGDAAGFPVYLLSRFAREQVKVVLTGDGGDELFGGYRRYAFDQLASYYQKLPRLLTNNLIPQLVHRLPRQRRLKQLARLWPIPDPAGRYAQWLTVFQRPQLAQLLSPEVNHQLGQYDPTWPYTHFYPKLISQTAADHLNRLMYTDVKTRLADAYLEKVDKAMMACSLEGRIPLLDHRLVELAFQIPGRLKVKGFNTKQIFKEAVKPLVPPVVLNRPKHGFSVPTDPWFRGELKQFTFDILLDQRTKQRGYFNSSQVEKLWREHVSGQETWDTHLWLLLNFELWHRLYLDGQS